MSDGITRTRGGNLTAALVAVAFLELLLNRLATHLFLPRSTISGEGMGSPAARMLADSGPFLFHLTAVLVLFVLVTALVGLLRRGELFPRPTRITVTVIALVFSLLGAVAVLLGQMPPGFFVPVELSFAFLSMLILASVLGSEARGRVKAGVALFTLPGVLHVMSIIAERKLQPPIAAEITRVGELALLAAAIAAPLLLPPRPLAERRWRLPLAVASLVTAAFVLLLTVRFDLMQASALYSLRIEIPHLGSLLGIAYALALFGWVFATVELVADKGGMRLAGYGLLLVAIAGTQAASPVELGLALVGLLALSVGELRAASYGDPRITRAGRNEWRSYVGRLATAVGDATSPDELPPEAVVVEDGEMEVSRIRTHRRGQLVALRLLRRRSVLVELDATVGQPGRTGPDASIERHRSWLARSPGERVKLPRTKTGDAAFDRKFSVHGAAPLADTELRRRLIRHDGDGAFTVWRGVAARYILASPGTLADAPPPFSGRIEGDAAVSSVVEIVDMLADLIDASAPASA